MSKQLVTRATTNEFEVAGRTLEGVALRLERPSRVTDDNWQTSYYEGWRTKAVERAVDGTWPLDRQHKGTPLGDVAFNISDVHRALMFTAVVAEGEQGDKLLADVASGDWSDASVAGYVLRSQKLPDEELGVVKWVLDSKLTGLAIARTGTGLHKGSEVLVMRATTTPRLDALRKKRLLLL